MLDGKLQIEQKTANKDHHGLEEAGEGHHGIGPDLYLFGAAYFGGFNVGFVPWYVPRYIFLYWYHF